ncbi:cryptochrome-2-like [Meleagris gallopavo]|uniref:cryptochrome-2-like n=1 Tax=Meleagris gallopavo TaxID=9103 RepID=UPI0012AB510D|nr:cryptochrome-2-like [Meleagris gallopavo]
MAEREKGAASPPASSPFLGLHLASPPNFSRLRLPASVSGSWGGALAPLRGQAVRFFPLNVGKRLGCRFLLQSLEDLDNSLRKLNSRLFVVRGQPTDVFPRLFKEWGVTRLTFEYDSEPFGKERDAAIIKLAKEAGVEVVVENSHTLYDLDR